MHRMKAGERMFNIFQALLGSVIMENFSTKRGSYNLHHFATLLTEMCSSSCTAAMASHNLERRKVPSGRWFRNMAHAISPDQLQMLARIMLDETVRICQNSHLQKSRDLLIAIDKHMIPKFDRGDITGLVRAKEKAGSTLFECYATMQIVSGQIPAILECIRVTPCLSNADLLLKLTASLSAYGIRERLLLLDREFFAVDLMGVLSGAGRRFLMPARKHAGIKRAIDEFIAGRRAAISEYTMKNAAGLTFTFTLVITKKAGRRRKGRYRSKEEEECTKSRGPSGKKKKEKSIYDDYIAFATNLPVEGIMGKIGRLIEDYRGRWRIEIGYRQAESVRPWTTSKEPGYHFLLFIATLFMHNMWAFERITRDISKDEMVLKALIRHAVEHAAGQIAYYVDPGGGRKNPGPPAHF